MDKAIVDDGQTKITVVTLAGRVCISTQQVGMMRVEDGDVVLAEDGAVLVEGELHSLASLSPDDVWKLVDSLVEANRELRFERAV